MILDSQIKYLGCVLHIVRWTNTCCFCPRESVGRRTVGAIVQASVGRRDSDNKNNVERADREGIEVRGRRAQRQGFCKTSLSQVIFVVGNTVLTLRPYT